MPMPMVGTAPENQIESSGRAPHTFTHPTGWGIRRMGNASAPYFHQYSTCTPKLEPLRALPKAPVSDSAEPSASRFAAS